jgi:hypothetical protein
MTATSEATPPTEPSDQVEPTSPSGHKARRRAAVILIVIASILTPIAVDALWVKRTLLDTDRFVEELGPLADNPEIQALVAERISDELIAQADLDTRLQNVLPENLQFLDGTLANAGDGFIRQAATAVTASDQFANLWREALRISHSKVVAVLTGDTDTVQVDDGVVSIDLSSLRDSVRERVSQTGLARFLPAASEKPLEITLYQSDALASAQSLVQLLKVVGFVLPFLVLVLFGTAIALAIDRRKAVFRVGLGLTIAMVLQLVAILFGRSFYLDAVSNYLPQPPASAIFDILVYFPRSGTRAVLFVGLVLMIGAAVFGSSRAAVRTREVVSRGIGGAGGKVGGDRAPGPVTSFFARHRRPLEIAVLVLAALFVISFDRVTVRNLLFVILLTLVALAVVRILAVAGTAADGEVDDESDPSTAPTLEQAGVATTAEDDPGSDSPPGS